jgi:hypothetical protein
LEILVAVIFVITGFVFYVFKLSGFVVFRLENMVESVIGIRGKDFVLLAQDANTTKYGILNMKFDTNRLFKLSEHCAMLAGKIDRSKII